MDPQTIAPGQRQPPPGGMTEAQARSVLSFMQRTASGEETPPVSPDMRLVALTLGRYCASCHMLDGEGASSAPDLSHVGATRDVEWLRTWIASPESVDPFASMPAFGDTLSGEELRAIVAYLAARK
jgi:mono/diheme cytochrome c family protein